MDTPRRHTGGRHGAYIAPGYRCAYWLDINVSFTYGSGLPTIPPIGFRPRIFQTQDSLTGTVTPTLDIDWRGVVFIADRGGLRNLNSGCLPEYVRQDFRTIQTTMIPILPGIGCTIHF